MSPASIHKRTLPSSFATPAFRPLFTRRLLHFSPFCFPFEYFLSFHHLLFLCHFYPSITTIACTHCNITSLQTSHDCNQQIHTFLLTRSILNMVPESFSSVEYLSMAVRFDLDTDRIRSFAEAVHTTTTWSDRSSDPIQDVRL